MAVLAYIDHTQGKVKKASFETASYAFALAQQLGTQAHAICIGNLSDDELNQFSSYGISKIHNVKADFLQNFDVNAYAKALSNLIQEDIVIFSHNYNGKALSSFLAAKLNAGLVSGAIGLPKTDDDFIVRKNVFSGKAYADVKINSEKKVITVNSNAFGIHENATELTIENIDSDLTEADVKVNVNSINKVSESIPLPDADLVVSAGRGLKGPENWGMVDDLANTLGAATACSRPVADVGWRPHHEHVGQTGVTVRPILYIAIAISGAIQHLAGVNGSKVIVVINKDPEAPFFKAADYGIVGDAFEVIPKLNEAFKKVLN